MTLMCCGFLLLVTGLTSGQEPSEEPTILTLNEAVALAMTNSYRLKNSGYDLQIADSTLRIANDRFIPKVSLLSEHSFVDAESAAVESSSLETLTTTLELKLGADLLWTGATIDLYTDFNGLATSGQTVSVAAASAMPDYYRSAYGLRIAQPLLRNGWYKVASAPLKQAKLTVASTDLGCALEVQQTIYEVITTYFNALKAIKLVSVYESALVEANEHYQLANTKLREGLVAPLQVAQSELQAARQRTALILVERNAEEALDRLKLTLSIDLSVPIELSQDLNKVIEDVDSQDLITEALTQRVELKQLGTQLESQKLAMLVSSNARLPNVNLNFDAAILEQDEEFDNAVKPRDQDYMIGLGINYVFGAKIEAETYYQETLRYRKLENDLAQLKLEITQQVKSALRTYTALQASLAVSQKAVDLATEGLELAKKSYSEGLISNLDLLKAQDEQLSANTGYFTDLIDLQTAKAGILLAVGRKLDPFNLSLSLESQPLPPHQVKTND